MFLKRTGTATPAGGALWAAPQVLTAPPVFAAGTITGAWTPLDLDLAPTARFAHAMAADANGNVILFGGNNGGSYLGDTWIWS